MAGRLGAGERARGEAGTHDFQHLLLLLATKGGLDQSSNLPKTVHGD